MPTENIQFNDDLIELIRSGNEHAFAQLHEAYKLPLFYFTNKLIEDAQVSQEIVSETFLKLWHLRANFSVFKSTISFLSVNCRNAGLDYLRYTNTTKYKTEVLVDSVNKFSEDEIDESILHKIIETEVLKQVYDAISKLPPRRKEVIEMLFIEGLTTGEVADRLKLSDQTVRATKFEALKELRNNTVLRKIISLLITLLHYLQ